MAPRPRPFAALVATARALGRGAVDLWLPRACARCGRGLAPHGEAPLCAACARALPRLPPAGCPLCQAAAPPGQRCAACRRERLPLDRIAAEAPFADEVASWLHRFKYPPPGLAGLDPRPAALVCGLVEAALARLEGPPPGCVVPVPLHPRRLRARGFHPAGVLARSAARALGVPCCADALRAVRATASQTGLDRAARRRNVTGAFAPRPGWAAPRRVLLVDDVVTTGATLAACARALRRAGARRVAAVCAARTP